MNRLWAPWRMAYIGGPAASGCVFCDALAVTDDRARFVLRRGERSFLILNAFPYSPGHLMAVLNRHVGSLLDVGADELADAMQLVQVGIRALAEEYRPHGFNVGMNQGAAAGAGIADHLHVHVVPRWNGDTNFVTTLANARVIPEALDRTWERLRSRLGG